MIAVLVLVGLLFLAVVTSATAQDRTRVDLYDARANRTGYAVIDEETGRIDYYDRDSRRTGYGKVDSSGRVERFDLSGRRVSPPSVVVPPARLRR